MKSGFQIIPSPFFLMVLVILTLGSGKKVFSQPLELLPTIGIDHNPAPDEDICDIPLRLETNFAALGPQIGDAFADFTFYDINGDSVNLKSTLELGKPVVLITCSYTCYVFRSQLQAIKDLQTSYGDKVTILLMYVIEAHPITDINPYFGYVNPSLQNLQDSILYNEPIVYGDRIATATDMINDLDINIPVILDGPCNEFWTWSVCGPNTGYLIDTNGIIATKHGWFNNQGQNMGCSIDSLLGNPSQCGADPTGQISFELNCELVQHAAPGATMYFNGTLTNNDTFDATVDITISTFFYPSDWLYAICADICYPPMVDSINFIVTAGTELGFVYDMITSETQDAGLVKLTVKNHFNPDEIYSYNLKGITDSSLVSVNSLPENEAINISPNPANNNFLVTENKNSYPIQYEIVDCSGRLVKSEMIESPLELVNTSGIPSGTYLLRINYSKQFSQHKIVILH